MHLLLALDQPEAVRGSLATHAGGPAVVVPATAAAGDAPVAVAVKGRAEEAQSDLRKVAAQSA